MGWVKKTNRTSLDEKGNRKWGLISHGGGKPMGQHKLFHVISPLKCRVTILGILWSRLSLGSSEPQISWYSASLVFISFVTLQLCVATEQHRQGAFCTPCSDCLRNNTTCCGKCETSVLKTKGVLKTAGLPRYQEREVYAGWSWHGHWVLSKPAALPAFVQLYINTLPLQTMHLDRISESFHSTVCVGKHQTIRKGRWWKQGNNTGMQQGRVGVDLD